MWYNVDMINDSAWQGRPTWRGRPALEQLALIVTAQFMVILDVAIVNVALPAIKSDLEFSETSLQWVISAYAILFGGLRRSAAGSPTSLAAAGCSSPGSPLRCQLASLRFRMVGSVADRLPRAAGSRRSVARPGRPLAPDALRFRRAVATSLSASTAPHPGAARPSASCSAACSRRT